jgi:hypothetical protein
VVQNRKEQGFELTTCQRVWEHEKIAVEQFLYKTTTRKGENISFYETEGLPPTGYIFILEKETQKVQRGNKCSGNKKGDKKD